MTDSANLFAERTALKGAFYGMAPDWFIDEIQKELRAFGVEPSIKNTSLELGVIGFLLIIISGLILKYVSELYGKHTLLFISLVLISIGLYFFYNKETTNLKTFLKSTDFFSKWILAIVIIWIVVWLLLIKRVPIMKTVNMKNGKDTLLNAIGLAAPWNSIMEMFFGKDHHKIKNIGPKSMGVLRIGWTALTVIIIVFVILWKEPQLESFVSRLYKGDTKEPFQDKASVQEATDPTAEQVTLVNIQPVSVKQAGYKGPEEKDGSFETDAAIINAVRAGVRFFTLQIDYLDKSPGPGFDAVNIPTLVYRDNKGNVISKNGASIADLAKQLSTYAFNQDFPSSGQPLILYLHFVRTPNPITKPDAYMKFLSAVARALAPIQPLILDKHDTADFTRQKNERVLLYSPLSNFDGKVLVWTNADTTVFRNAAKLSMTPVPLAQDLDYMTSMRVYLDDPDDVLGVTSVSAEVAHAVIIPFKRFKSMKDKEKTDFAMKGKARFVIAMPAQMDKPAQKDIIGVLTMAGVNTVPVNLFGAEDTDIKAQINLWSANPFYKLKPVLLQSTKAAVAGYIPPPNALRAP